MLVEILTRNMHKKNTILTLMSGSPGLEARGDHVALPGISLHLSDNYMLFKISSAEWAEQIVPALFSVVPVIATGQFHQPETDMKIIVTARAYKPAKILPHLHEVSHLDLEHGELMGTRFIEWRSRDVAVVAQTELAVQGSVLTARVKFSTHFRDSQYNCQACVDQVSLRQIMEPLSPDFIEPPPTPRMHGPVIKAQQKVTPHGWVEFIHRKPGSLHYYRNTEEFKIVFNGSGFISFKQDRERGEILCMLELTSPAPLDNGTLQQLHDLLGLEKVVIEQVTENLLLSPDRLLNELGFNKQHQFYLFTRDLGDFTAVYDIKRMQMKCSKDLSLKNNNFRTAVLQDVFQRMVEFMNTVVAYAK